MKLRGTHVVAAAALAGVLPGQAGAIEVYNQNGLTIEAGIEAGAGGFLVDNPNFGLGRVDLESGNNTGDSEHAEGYVEPSLSFNFAPGGMFELYGKVSVVGATTLGDGDAGGFTSGDEADFGLEQAHLGFRATLGEGENPWVLDVSGGRNDLSIGNAWLFADGNFDGFSDTNFWLAPRSAFRRAGIVDLSNGMFGAKAFFVQADRDQDRPEVFGGDLRYTGDWGEIGILYAQIVDSRDIIFTREGMEMVSIRALGVPVPMVDGLSFSAEYTDQFGGDGANDFDAYAFYGQVDYNFSSLPWSPTLTYRYARFSGQSLGGGDVEAFDPLFYGFDGWGTWFQGEIMGEYILFNSNQRNHMVKLSGTPTDSIEVGAIYYNFDLDEKNFFGTPVTSRNFADEINFYVDWGVNDNVSFSAVAGAAFPDTAAKQAFGDNDNIYVLEAFVILNF